MLPMMVPLGVLQLSAFCDRFYAGVMGATPGAPQLGALGMTFDKPLAEVVHHGRYGAPFVELEPGRVRAQVVGGFKS